MNKKVLVFGAHPDDCEIGMGGTIRKLAKDGSCVTVVDLTQGEMSSNGNIFLRQSESKSAGKILGISSRENLMMPDRNIEHTISNIEYAANIIRKYEPDMVFLPSVYDSHPDHVAASKLIQEALFHAKLKKFESEYNPVEVKNAYMYHINNTKQSDFYVNISDEIEEKFLALACYSSQFSGSSSTSTRLNNGYLMQLKSTNNTLGYKCGVDYAEGFISLKPIVIHNISSMEAIIND